MVEAYHGTRISEEKIRTEGLVAPGCINYREWMLKGLEHFGIPLEQALKNEVAREVYSKTKEPKCFTNIWVTDDKEIACGYARNSPEDLSIFLNQAGIPSEQIKNYTEIAFGSPKCVTVDVPLPFNRVYDLQEAVGPRIPPEKIVNIEPCLPEE